ncbi:MAG: hypothetical protein RI101_06385 [Nitrospira sp.]|jgi:hypothetical protein|nr:hypothetical protein [Nitrospira sp.]
MVVRATSQQRLLGIVVALLGSLLLAPCAAWTIDAAAASADGLPSAAQSHTAVGVEADPFADLAELPAPQSAPEQAPRSWQQALFGENFGFRKEVMSQFDMNERGKSASRQSIGFEALKKFSTATATLASLDFQGRLVRRDGFNPVLNDMEGQRRPNWAFEYHNAYLDLYNVFNPLLSDRQRSETVGQFNLRAGRFYVPFGLNLQTDTHGTVLQLSNDRNFGFERDWYTGFWGSINSHVNYDAYYLAGSGYDLKFKGQSGLGALRLSLANKYSYEYGLEGGLSILGGERLSPDAITRRRALAMDTGNESRVATKRVGLDGRYRQAVPTGLLTVTSELSGGRDLSSAVFTQLYQAEYLHASRQWGVSTQYRRFQQEGLGADASIIGEISWYFRNDIGNSNLHWIKLNVERQVEQMQGPCGTIMTLQYYFYQ